MYVGRFPVLANTQRMLDNVGGLNLSPEHSLAWKRSITYATRGPAELEEMRSNRFNDHRRMPIDTGGIDFDF
jgi:hypothetical protein